MMVRLKLFFVILFVLFIVPISYAQSIELTTEEQQFIKTHPIIKIGIDDQFTPFVIKDKNGNLSGFEVDHLALLSESTGIEFQLVVGSWDHIVKQSKNRTIDGLAYSAVIESRRNKLNFSVPYLRSDQILYSHDKSRIANASNLDQFKNSTIGLQRNNAFTTNLAKKIPGVNLQFYDTLDKLINALATRQIDYAISGSDINYIATKRSLPNVLANYVISDYPLDIVYSLRNDWPELTSIINKGINQIPDRRKDDIITKWILFETKPINIDLTEKERKFIQSHPEIHFGAAKEEEPFIIVKNGKTVGFDIDLIEEINSISGLNITIVPDEWNIVLEQAKQKKLDGLVTSVYDKDRSQYFNFSNPYIDVYAGIFSLNSSTKKIHSISDLQNHKTGYLKGFDAVTTMLKSDPKIETIEYNTRQELTQALIKKEIQYAVTLSNYEFYLSSKGISAIKMDCLIDQFPMNLIYTTRNDWPELHSILNKCIEQIKLKDRVALLDSWISFNHPFLRKSTLNLSKEEIRLLKRTNQINIGFIGNWMPLAGTTDDDHLNGMLKDYLNNLEEKLNLKLVTTNCNGIDSMFSKIQKKEVDFGITAKLETAKDITLSSNSLITEPFALVTTIDVPYKNNLEYSNNLTVGIQKNNPFTYEIKRQFPNIEFVLVDDIKQGFELVLSNKLDGYMTLLPIAIFNIKSLGMQKLGIGSVTDTKISFQFATIKGDNDNKELIPILNKAISSISGSEIEKIKEKWYRFEMEKEINYSQIISAVTGLVAVILLIFIWNRMLAAQIKRRKKTEHELREAQKKQDMFVQAIELSDDYIFFTDTDGKFLYVNKSAREKFGMDKDITALHFEDILSPESALATQQLLDTIVLENGSARVEGNVLHYYSKNPTKVDSNILQVKDQQTQEIKYYVNIGRDISEKNKLLKDLEEAKKQAEESNEAKTEFLANMSHEIRTPLNGVIGMTDLLAELDLSEDAKLYTKTISDSGNILLSLINNILDISKIEAEKMSLENYDFELESVLQTVVELCKVNAGRKELEISYQISSELAKVFSGDRNKLTQVLLNLMGNAVKFTSKGSVILEAKHSDNPKELIFNISDTGMGIAKKEIPHLFNKFYQSESGKNSKQVGTGLGLVISKKIIELMNGNIQVKSSLGKGTTFSFNVILNDSHKTTNDVITSKEKPFKILIAEDNEINQLVMTKQFEGLDLFPEIVDDGTKVLEKLKSEEYDLIFMDLGMPNLDGLETTKEIRKKKIKQPVIIALTASAIKNDRKKCIQAGMDDYLSKPISIDKLKSTINLWKEKQVGYKK